MNEARPNVDFSKTSCCVNRGGKGAVPIYGKASTSVSNGVFAGRCSTVQPNADRTLLTSLHQRPLLDRYSNPSIESNQCFRANNSAPVSIQRNASDAKDRSKWKREERRDSDSSSSVGSFDYRDTSMRGGSNSRHGLRENGEGPRNLPFEATKERKIHRASGDAAETRGQ